jgi:hypothetical protein
MARDLARGHRARQAVLSERRGRGGAPDGQKRWARPARGVPMAGRPWRWPQNTTHIVRGETVRI